MLTTSSIRTLRNLIGRLKKAGKRVGFVPTMGALHQGHLCLIQAAQRQTDYVVVSIFVNPMQFGPNEDYAKYPRTLGKDLRLLKKLKTDAVFAPAAEELYPKDFSTYVEETSRAQGLCAKTRPDHFKGVCTIVAKLFNIVTPDIAYFGQKDFQQACVIKKMTQDLDFPVIIKTMPTVREKNGMAMSSRNRYLSVADRAKAAVLYRALRSGCARLRAGERNTARLIAHMKKVLATERALKVDYLEVRDARTLAPVHNIKTKVVIAVAAFLGKVRLIDNIVCEVN